MALDPYPEKVLQYRGLGITASVQTGANTLPKNLGRVFIPTTAPYGGAPFYTPAYQFMARTSGSPTFVHAFIHALKDKTYASASRLVQIRITTTQKLQTNAVISLGAEIPSTVLPASATTLQWCPDFSRGLAVTHCPSGADPNRVQAWRDDTNPILGSVALSGATLGLDADLFPLSYASRYESNGIIRVIGLYVRGTTVGSRTNAGDPTGYEMWGYALDVSNILQGLAGAGTVTESAYQITSDVPFAPHELAKGKSISLEGLEPSDTAWCIGRYDPNGYSPANVFTQLPSGITALNYDVGTSNLSAEGIWVCDNYEKLDSWRLVWQAPTQTITPEGAEGGNYQMELGYTPRDLGICFDPSWQRLTTAGVDTDSSQDPAIRWLYV